MTRVPLERLARRLAFGLFLDVWPVWTAAALLAAGAVAIVCRIFLPGASPWLVWLWLTPVACIIPALVICYRRAYTPEQVATLADLQRGGDGLLLAVLEREDEAWRSSRRLTDTAMPLPSLQPWKRLRLAAASAAFLAVALLLPQRVPAASADAALANHVVDDLVTTVQELKSQQLVTPEEEQKLQEEIEEIRKAAEKRLDPSTWEAADSLQERLAAEVSKKQDAAAWAQESLQRYADAAEAGSAQAGAAASNAAEVQAALKALAESGMLANAPEELQRLARNGARLPGDLAALRRLQEMLGAQLGNRTAGMARGRGAGRGGRFDPEEFPLESPDGEAVREGRGRNARSGTRPGRGGIDRGRGDATLTWGDETQPFDRFKAQSLPPGYARTPDDFAPLVELPGAPAVSPEASRAAAARRYGATAGQEAWRRTLAPRHQSAVRKYFQESP